MGRLHQLAERMSRCLEADEYLAAREGNYEQRTVRYGRAYGLMWSTLKLEDSDTLVDVGAGWTELDYYLRREANWRGRYIPVDAGVDGTDLDDWIPPRRVDWFVCLEVLEHLRHPYLLLDKLEVMANKGVIFSTPNPEVVNVLGMDATHLTALHIADIRKLGYVVISTSFYGQPNDSLFAWKLNKFARGAVNG